MNGKITSVTSGKGISANGPTTVEGNLLKTLKKNVLFIFIGYWNQAIGYIGGPVTPQIRQIKFN